MSQRLRAGAETVAVQVVCKPDKCRGPSTGITGVLRMALEGLGWGVHELVALLLSRNLVAKRYGSLLTRKIALM